MQDEDLGLQRLLTEEKEKHEAQNIRSNVIKYQRKGKGKLGNSSKLTGKEGILSCQEEGKKESLGEFLAEMDLVLVSNKKEESRSGFGNTL